MNQKTFKVTDLPYGVIIGLTGYYHDSKHCFVAEKVFLPSLPDQKKIQSRSHAQARKALIVSYPTIEMIEKLINGIVFDPLGTLKHQITSIIIMGLTKETTAADLRALDHTFSSCS